MKKRCRYLVANLSVATLLGGFFYLPAAQASNWWYVEAGLTRTRIDVDGTEFNPLLPRLKLGFIFTPHWMVEVQYTGSGDDTVANTQLEVDNIRAAYLRLDSGIRSTMRMYVLLGGAETELSTKNPAGSITRTDTYGDFSWAVGFEDRVWSKNTLLTVEYSHYYSFNDVTITGVSLGFKYEY